MGLKKTGLPEIGKGGKSIEICSGEYSTILKQFLFYFLCALLCSACGAGAQYRSDMKVHAIRLHPGQDLRRELEAFAKKEKIDAGFVLSCVGSLRKMNIRPANQQTPIHAEQKFEIVSLVGTLSPDGVHLHIALSDSTGATIGGHLLEGNEIYTTAEIVIGEARHLQFRRETDPETTFKELVIRPK